MKTAEHYLMRWRDNEFELHELIELAQKEAYNQALDDKLDANKIHIMLSGIKIDNDNLDYIKLTGEICGNLRWDLVEAIKNLKK